MSPEQIPLLVTPMLPGIAVVKIFTSHLLCCNDFDFQVGTQDVHTLREPNDNMSILSRCAIRWGPSHTLRITHRSRPFVLVPTNLHQPAF